MSLISLHVQSLTPTRTESILSSKVTLSCIIWRSGSCPDVKLNTAEWFTISFHDNASPNSKLVWSARGRQQRWSRISRDSTYGRLLSVVHCMPRHPSVVLHMVPPPRGRKDCIWLARWRRLLHIELGPEGMNNTCKSKASGTLCKRLKLPHWSGQVSRHAWT